MPSSAAVFDFRSPPTINANENQSSPFDALRWTTRCTIAITLTVFSSLTPTGITRADEPCLHCNAAEQIQEPNHCTNCSKCRSGTCYNGSKCGNQDDEVRSKRILLGNRTDFTQPSPICPVLVPAYVGHTTITHDPSMPHQLLRPHLDIYRHKNPEGQGIHRTRVSYRISVESRIRNLRWNALRFPR
jgi:hypothetical protein